MAWLTRVPVAVVRSCSAMIDRLRAEEALLGASVAAVGSGTRKRSDARAQLARWEREARPEPVRRLAPGKSPSPETLRAMGITMRTVPRG